MQTIRVNLKENSYQIHIGFGLISEFGQRLRQVVAGDKLVIVTNPVIEDLYRTVIKQNLNNCGFEVTILKVPEGEEQKSLQNASALYGELSNCHAERTTPILALGGGVIGDLAGFVAATYLRGVPFIQIPTTLLAQVDSSVGGKVAVDYNKLKNKIGAFYQPKLVVTDIETLHTLPQRDIVNGMAEIIKHAIIWDKKLFDYIENNINKIKALDTEVIEELIVKAVKIKAEIIEKDEKDINIRNILNYGHTIGHAIETLSEFKLKHGEAVAIGMVTAGRISSKLGMLSLNELSRMKEIIKKVGLPTKVPEFGIDQLIEAMRHDKKVLAGKIRFVLLDSIGKAMVFDDVSLSLVKEVLNDHDG
jgi:3-dehydroquinate synthase